MPGIFGGVGCPPHLHEALRADFAAAYGASDAVSVAGGMLGGHAFGSQSALHVAPDGDRFAVDGEPSLYRSTLPPYRVRSDALELEPTCKGNVAVVSARSGTWHLATEWTGSFPLYYVVVDGGLLFSSRLRPLARIAGASLDLVGILEVLERYSTLAGRTHFEEIRRLLPGQILRYEPGSGRLSVRETSALWAGDRGEAGDGGDAVEQAWVALGDSVRRSLGGPGRHAVMMSGGWDSRTLLAAMLEQAGRDPLLAYTHGDLGSREIGLVERICGWAGVELHREPLGEAMYDLDALERGFERTENLMFPHWHRAGAVLAGLGLSSVSAGVYGEVLGGHYGPSMVVGGVRKMAAVAAALVGRSVGSRNGHQAARDFLLARRVAKPWYLAPAAWDATADAAASLDADLEAALQRLERRGVVTGDELVEAFVTEQRGTQYINAQILSCRANLDVTMPYTDRALLALSTRIPVKTKIHNTLNRAMLARHVPGLLQFPCSATLVPARAPVVAQELSRLVRRKLDDSRWRLYFSSRGRLPQPRLGWGNFEFLRTGRVLNALADDLRADVWDRGAIRDRIAAVTPLESRGSVHRLSFQLMRIYTVDQMLRAAPPRSAILAAPEAGRAIR
ncbi:MAG: hypothetical protein E6J75_18755 [Deltaproteobacteria bacterium]|nr:MAG: hypothetical protein E6J75_18755 [Deltaproteobacteria bacterium]